MEITIDDETLALLDSSAEFRSLSRSEMLRQAIRDAADYDRYYRESVEAGMRDLKEGRVISNEQMNAEMDALIQRLRQKHK